MSQQSLFHLEIYFRALLDYFRFVVFFFNGSLPSHILLILVLLIELQVVAPIHSVIFTANSLTSASPNLMLYCSTFCHIYKSWNNGLAKCNQFFRGECSSKKISFETSPVGKERLQSFVFSLRNPFAISTFRGFCNSSDYHYSCALMLTLSALFP